MSVLESTSTNQQTGFSRTMAEYFTDHFAAIETQLNTAAGYSGTLFGHRESVGSQQYVEYTFSQRAPSPMSSSPI